MISIWNEAWNRVKKGIHHVEHWYLKCILNKSTSRNHPLFVYCILYMSWNCPLSIHIYITYIIMSRGMVIQIEAVLYLRVWRVVIFIHIDDPKEVMTWHLNSFSYLKGEKRHLMCLMEHHSMRPYFICHKNKLNFLICLIFLPNDKIWYNGMCQYQKRYILQEIEF